MFFYGFVIDKGEAPSENRKSIHYYSEAIPKLKKLISKGDYMAMNNYGFMLLNGFGVAVNKKEAARYYKMSADKGDADGLNNYGPMLDNGERV